MSKAGGSIVVIRGVLECPYADIEEECLGAHDRLRCSGDFAFEVQLEA